MPFPDFLRTADEECAGHVSFPLNAVQFDLRTRGPDANKVVHDKAYPLVPAHLVGEQKRLIETPRPEPSTVQGDGHDHVDGQKNIDMLRHPAAERFSESTAGPVLELVDGFAQRSLKEAR